MHIIHKKILKDDPGTESFFIPVDAEILDIQVQDNQPVLWYLHNGNENQNMIILDKFITGREIPEDTIHIKRKFLKTVLLSDGAFVLHIFERQVLK